jgi:hypothetical protein
LGDQDDERTSVRASGADRVHGKPLSALRGGALSGKYKRADKGKHEAGRGARVRNYLDDRTFERTRGCSKTSRRATTTRSMQDFVDQREASRERDTV